MISKIFGKVSMPESLNVLQLRVPDPDPGDEEENQEMKEANK